MLAGMVINGGLSWNGWTYRGLSNEGGLYGSGGTTSRDTYEVYTVAFAFAGNAISGDPVKAVAPAPDDFVTGRDAWIPGGRQIQVSAGAFEAGNTILGIGVRATDSAASIAGFSPTIRFDLDNDSFTAASFEKDSLGRTTTLKNDGRTSFSTYAEPGDFTVQFEGSASWRGSSINVREAATAQLPAATVQLPGGVGSGTSYDFAFRAFAQPAAKSYQMFLDMTAIPKLYGSVYGTFFPGRAGVGTIGDRVTVSLNGLGTNNVVFGADLTLPSVDLDIDSNNDGAIDPDNGKDGKDDPVEDRADLPGKRIFLNIDDDNQNGLPDHIDSHSAYVAKAADDDFAEMRLKVAAAALGPLEGFTVRLRYPAAHIRLHATREKLGLVRDLTDDTDDGSRPYTLPETGDGFYAWQLEPNVRLPDAVYAEGVTTGRSQVTLELVSPGGDVVKSDAVNLRVENIRLPNAGNQATDWHKENTDTWAGLKLEPGWWIDRSLEKIINAPDERHAIEIRTRYAEGKTADGGGFAVYGKEAWEGEGTPSKSVSTYANGFTLNFDFMFDPGYVQADDSKDGKPGNDHHKLSFFPNSGIKIWGLYEIAIFDSRKVATLPSLVVDGDGKLAATGYEPPEHATTLMTGVAYGVTADARMTDLKNNGGGLYDPIATLIAAAGRLRDDWMAMEITFTPNQDANPQSYAVEVKLDNDVVFSDPNVTNGTGGSATKALADVAGDDQKIVFQNHWDSGVKFKNVSIA